MSSESECSCRVEGSGSQCNVLIQPNHQAVLVREQHSRTHRHTEKKKMESNGEDGRQEERENREEMLKVEEERERQRRRRESVLIEKHQRAGDTEDIV